jgi:hypothetical protein
MAVYTELDIWHLNEAPCESDAVKSNLNKLMADAKFIRKMGFPLKSEFLFVLYLQLFANAISDL